MVNFLARLPKGVRYAIFALPMAIVLGIGVFYVAYARFVCDPLYARDPKTAGYDAQPAMSSLGPLLPPGFESAKIPVRRRHFGPACP